MTRLTLVCLMSLLLFSTAEAAQNEDIIGFWKTVHEKTLKPESIIAIYPYKGNYYGRIILTYHDDGTVQDTIHQPKKRAPGVVGNPFYSGLDFMWGLKPKGDKYLDGNIMDPLKGNIYGAEAWRKGEHLIVRGKLFIFGRNQTWPPAVEADFPVDFKLPDLTAFVPVIPRSST